MESKWADAQFEAKKTPDLDQMDLEQYQVRIESVELSLGFGFIAITNTTTNHWPSHASVPFEANNHKNECESA